MLINSVIATCGIASLWLKCEIHATKLNHCMGLRLRKMFPSIHHSSASEPGALNDLRPSRPA
eukprot:767703-Hanusia_phi.AAC.1